MKDFNHGGINICEEREVRASLAEHPVSTLRLGNKNWGYGAAAK